MRRRSHPADLTDLHILVVEDNELNLEIAVFSLEAAGLNVSTAINGLEAVQLFEKSKPYEYDIILMDIMMPVMNGLDAAKAIRGLSRPDAPTVPIIALSANAFAEDIQKSKNAGINEHLAKPEFLFYKKSDYQAICHFPDNPIFILLTSQMLSLYCHNAETFLLPQMP